MARVNSFIAGLELTNKKSWAWFLVGVVAAYSGALDRVINAIQSSRANPNP